MKGPLLGSMFSRHVKRHPGLIPLIGFISVGLGSAVLYLLRLALYSPDVRYGSGCPWAPLGHLARAPGAEGADVQVRRVGTMVHKVPGCTPTPSWQTWVQRHPEGVREGAEVPGGGEGTWGTICPLLAWGGDEGPFNPLLWALHQLLWNWGLAGEDTGRRRERDGWVDGEADKSSM
ncbi:NADH dehydrogenase [ubiquinone] 1 alpha subcomplex subunit 4-like 2 isoform X1 [Falco naumanni]|uniref:NADH dehydrogenase [ubiquinone] 1 alpha subcomplex subunit 4-like 2 isoform X1 n=1 Tax=Falco naumanni TaxID=148594 RepID=UPI001ADE2063|nr:NADH dehydrogenase [ubiquinone] 1 alpha subcomplex subunit 4-like 2 isoform X1 [Falco naumanni]